MKKFVLILAAALTSAAMAFAQDYNEVVDSYNKAAETLESGDLEAALASFQETYKLAQAIEEEDVTEIISVCKTQIPTLAYNLAVREYNNSNFKLAAEKALAAAELCEQFENAEKQAEALAIAADSKYYYAKDLEDTDMEAAKVELKALHEAGEARATGRLGFLLSKEATDLQKEASALTDAAAKKEAFKKVYEVAKEAIGYEDSAAAEKTLATAARNIDKWDEAIAGYEKYLELKPEAKDVLSITNNLAMCYEKVGNKTKALELYKVVAAGDNEKLKASALKKIEKLTK
ncbi:MAG: hypothetical protein LIQ26_05045 [Bacteroidota bacterium]|nr:hypothetical protein [Bacteroidota bacterium]